MTNQQLELGFGGAKTKTLPSRHESRIQRAAWWFARMREAVNNAIDWQSLPPAPPQQEWLGLSRHRQSA